MIKLNSGANKFKLFVTFLLMALILIFVCTSNFLYEKIDVDAGVHWNRGNSFIQAHLNLKETKDTKIKEQFDLSENWFQLPVEVYNHELALTSLGMSMCAFSADDAGAMWGVNAACGREKNIRQAYEDFGFENPVFYKYDKSLNDTSSAAGYSIAVRKLISVSPDTKLISVFVRGGGYGCEWADNFNLGDSSSKYHSGFYTAATEIKQKLDEYIQNETDYTNVKLWISGYSRGGAIANILASLYDEAATNCLDVYAYTFASPRCVIVSDEDVYEKKYDNIFNIISDNDPVSVIPPAKWDFGRFGRTVVLPGDHTEDEKYKAVSTAAMQTYKRLTGKNSNLRFENELQVLFELLVNLSETRDAYNSRLYPICRDYIKCIMAKEEKNGSWKRCGSQKMLYTLYGNQANTAIEKSTRSRISGIVAAVSGKIPDDLSVFFALCGIHGIENPEEKILNSLSPLKIAELCSAFSDAGGLAHTMEGHLPEVYLSWMKNCFFMDLTFKNE